MSDAVWASGLARVVCGLEDVVGGAVGEPDIVHSEFFDVAGSMECAGLRVAHIWTVAATLLPGLWHDGKSPAESGLSRIQGALANLRHKVGAVTCPGIFGPFINRERLTPKNLRIRIDRLGVA